MTQPRILLTMGDIAGIGPEVIVRAWPHLLRHATPVVVGDRAWLQRTIDSLHHRTRVQPIEHPRFGQPTPEQIPCLQSTDQNLTDVRLGHVSASAGKAAYDFLCVAIDLTLAGEADAIVTAPLHKEGLHAAGLHYPGHTEILAERTGTQSFAMLLHGPRVLTRHTDHPGWLTVAHVTLHMALRDVFRHLSSEAVQAKIELLNGVLPRLQSHPPRIAVAALNPHASDGGLFGDEEETIIAPAVLAAQRAGIDVSGPWPCDTLFVRADAGEFDGVVAIYHDQGHIAMKLRSGWHAVNITAGLPIIRTSVAHGTAYDIVGTGQADPASMIGAVEVATRLVKGYGQEHKLDGNHLLSDPSRSHPGQSGAPVSSARPVS